MNILDLINEGTKFLKDKNIPTANLDSEILMSKVLKKKREFIILNSNISLDNKSIFLFQDLIKERSLGKPVSYLVGRKEFWKYDFKINQGVLIPRPETELIIDCALKVTKNKSKLNILDIGVGSGCILLSLLMEKKDFRGVGVDISKKSIELSKINMERLGLKNRLKLFKSDIDNFNYGKYDLIISNPPYIKQLDLKNLEKDIINFEPILALNGGLDGLSEIRKVIKKSSELIKINGVLILEMAFNQREKVKKLLRDEGFYINQVIKDLAHNNRCIVCTKI